LRGVTRFFLRAKQWQIFALVFGSYIFGQIALLSSFPMSAAGMKNPLKFGFVSALAMLSFLLCFMAWLWSLGVVIVSDYGRRAQTEP
jgi:hypothetical protein